VDIKEREKNPEAPDAPFRSSDLDSNNQNSSVNQLRSGGALTTENNFGTQGDNDTRMTMNFTREVANFGGEMAFGNDG
jgi:hypothetical protein